MKNIKSIILLIFLLVLLSGCGKNDSNAINNTSNEIKEPEKKLKIVDTSSNSRPYAVMINNLSTARPYQSGLQDAYLVYEIIVEGGITRYMAVFKDKNTERIGSVRSSRHYYLDYALENDAIYAHFGWSPQAKSDISSMNINNINGLYYDGSTFVRDKTLNISYEHTAFTSMELLKKRAEALNYRQTSNKKLLLNYSIDDVNIDSFEDSILANNLSIKYSNSITTSYVYNSNDKLYYRSVNGKEHIDYVTKKQYTAKNIIVAYAKNGYIGDDAKGRQELENIGTGDGYYITNGYAIPIKWIKKDRESQTVYNKLTGEEITVNDGNTFIQISPINSCTIKGE